MSHCLSKAACGYSSRLKATFGPFSTPTKGATFAGFDARAKSVVFARWSIDVEDLRSRGEVDVAERLNRAARDAGIVHQHIDRAIAQRRDGIHGAAVVGAIGGRLNHDD